MWLFYILYYLGHGSVYPLNPLARPRARWYHLRGLSLVASKYVCPQCNSSFVITRGRDTASAMELPIRISRSQELTSNVKLNFSCPARLCVVARHERFFRCSTTQRLTRNRVIRKPDWWSQDINELGDLYTEDVYDAPSSPIKQAWHGGQYFGCSWVPLFMNKYRHVRLRDEWLQRHHSVGDMPQ